VRAATIDSRADAPAPHPKRRRRTRSHKCARQLLGHAADRDRHGKVRSFFGARTSARRLSSIQRMYVRVLLCSNRPPNQGCRSLCPRRRNAIAPRAAAIGTRRRTRRRHARSIPCALPTLGPARQVSVSVHDLAPAHCQKAHRNASNIFQNQRSTDCVLISSDDAAANVRTRRIMRTSIRRSRRRLHISSSQIGSPGDPLVASAMDASMLPGRRAASLLVGRSITTAGISGLPFRVAEFDAIRHFMFLVLSRRSVHRYVLSCSKRTTAQRRTGPSGASRASPQKGTSAGDSPLDV
jgi:hypothetical protein